MKLDPPHSPMQAMVDRMSAGWQRERAQTQMTLGELINHLVTEDGGPTHIAGFGDPHSYRGYYDDLAFEPSPEPRPIAELAQVAGDAMGKVFTGYKGGEYRMGEETPIWIAEVGDIGKKVTGLSWDGIEGHPLTPMLADDD